MAGVKPVEYKKDSSTTGFAIAGDQKQITKDNAVTIEKDVKQGNTNDLDNAQSKYLESQIEDVDNIEYSDDERKNVGKNQIDTTGEDGEDLSEKDGKAGAVTGGASAVAAAGLGAAASIIGCASTTKTSTTFASKIPGGMLAPGIIAAAFSAQALAFSFEGLFDPNLSERESQTASADENNQIIQSYYDQMAADMDTMTEDAATYADLSEQKVTSDVNRITQIGALQAQIAVYESQGNTEKVAELQAQIAELTAEGEADESGKKIDELQGAMETYSGNNAEAIGVADSGATVAEFLKDGNPMSNWAEAAKQASYLGAAVMLVCSALAGARIAKDLAGIFTAVFAGADGAGLALFAYSGLVLGMAGMKYGKIAEKESSAGDAGDQMQEYVNNLLGNVSSQARFTESTGAEYKEIATMNAKTTQKTQEGVDKANKNTPVVTPNTNDNGEGGNPDEEKPPVVGAGEGVAA